MSEDAYRDLMGREPPADPEHPLAKQWEYGGSKGERDLLAAELEGERGEQPEQDESLF